MWGELAGVASLTLGLVFCALAGVGVLRMPDVYTRMQASTKAGTLGIVFIIVAVAIHFGDAITAVQAALVIAFFFLTAPIASHLIARSVYFYGVRSWETGELDEMAEVSIIDVTAADEPPEADRPGDDPPPEPPDTPAPPDAAGAP